MAEPYHAAIGDQRFASAQVFLYCSAMPRPVFPTPEGSAGAAHFSGAPSLDRRHRAEALRAKAEGRAPRQARESAPAPAHEEAGDWPRPPSSIQAARLIEPPQGARVTVCGLVTVRQRPGSAKGVVFVTLEDETGVVNVIVWAKTFLSFRREVIAGRLLRVTGALQREGKVIHVVADKIEDVSPLLDRLAHLDRRFEPPLAAADEVRRPQPERAAAGLSGDAQPRATHPREQAKRLFPRRPAS